MSEEKPSVNPLEKNKAEELLKKRLILFLSVDIVGSTAFKHQGDSHQWLVYFSFFYENFNVFFENHLSDKSHREQFLGNPDLPLAKITNSKPRLWKTLGDELLFFHELNDHRQASFYVNCFRHAILDINTELKKKSDDRLKLKGTAWVAGFPVGNMLIVENLDAQKFDFIGPLVDVGFRLSKYSNEQKFVVSVDLALLLSHHVQSDDFQFHYDGRVPLKGVLNEKPYPIIWLRMVEDDFPLEATLIEKCEVGKIKAFCEYFIREIGKPLRVPFIIGDEFFYRIENEDEYNDSYNKVKKILADVIFPTDEIDNTQED